MYELASEGDLVSCESILLNWVYAKTAGWQTGKIPRDLAVFGEDVMAFEKAFRSAPPDACSNCFELPGALCGVAELFVKLAWSRSSSTDFATEVIEMASKLRKSACANPVYAAMVANIPLKEYGERAAEARKKDADRKLLANVADEIASAPAETTEDALDAMWKIRLNCRLRDEKGLVFESMVKLADRFQASRGSNVSTQPTHAHPHSGLHPFLHV